jgi:XTP/dITP diphosphohydrolase
LGDRPLERRTAHYVCHAVLCDPTGTIRAESEGECHGRIRFEPAGSGGFGYDPLFEIVEYHRTFGELGPVAKAVLSHRARAIRALIRAMLRLVDSGEWK